MCTLLCIKLYCYTFIIVTPVCASIVGPENGFRFSTSINFNNNSQWRHLLDAKGLDGLYKLFLILFFFFKFMTFFDTNNICAIVLDF